MKKSELKQIIREIVASIHGGEEERFGSPSYDREEAEERASRGQKSYCSVCHKPFTLSYGEKSSGTQ